ncbi:MAG TPA: hypothetical protein PLH19_08690 [Anaerolineae bacterium]|nr:hypothetical protein [Anaerolineae bacterium]HQH38593.1 hypothetical protein [Anaerolineae bacterium]
MTHAPHSSKPLETRPPLGQRGLLRAGGEYLRDFYGRQATGGLWLAHGLWRAGLAGRVGLVLLGGGLPLAAALLSGALISTAPRVLAFGLTLFAVAWAFILSAVTRLSLPGYVIVCAYLAWYGILAGGALAGTPWFALPTLWMLWVGGAVDDALPRLWRWVWRLPLDSGWMGPMAGGALALGFTTFWMSPEVLPIPLLAFINMWQRRYVDAVLNRPMMQAGQFWFTLLALAAGVGVGLAWKLHRRPLRLLVVAGCALAFAWLALHIPGM